MPADGKFNFCFVFVLQVATQGYSIASGGKVQKKDKCWVESYTLSFSTDGSRWQQYTENGAVKVFYKLLCIRSAYTFTAYLTIRPVALEGEGSNCCSITQLVGQKRQ